MAPGDRHPGGASGRLELGPGNPAASVVIDYWFDYQCPPCSVFSPTIDEVVRTIGRPSERAGAMRFGQIWSWRYANNDCLWWQAQLNAQGIVTSAGYAQIPGCDGPNERR